MIASGSLKEAGGGPKVSHRRTVMPTDRMIWWRPRASVSNGHHEPDGGQPRYEILVERDALSALNVHVAGDESEPSFGFLLGHLHRCPDSGRHYGTVEVAVPAKESLDEEASGAYLLRAWSETRPKLGGYSGLLLGWYHTHRHLGLMLSQADLDSGRRYFGAPWQVSIVVVPDADRPLGGVFRLPPPTAGPAAARPVPFYELLDVPPPSEAPAPTAVNWTNYESDRRVRMVPENPGHVAPPSEPAEARPPKTRSPQAVPPTGKLESARKEGVPGPRSPGVPLVMPAEGAETGLLPPRRRRVPWPLFVAAGLAVVLALVFLLPRTPGSGRDAGVRTTPVRASATPEEAAFLEDVEELELATTRYAERAGDFDAGRIGCDFLATGYVAADEAYFQVAATYKALGSKANAQAVAAYDKAGEAIAEVNTHFDASGCPRP